MNAAGTQAGTIQPRPDFAHTPTAIKPAEEVIRAEIGWWDVPRLPFRLMALLWRRLKPWLRSTLRIVTWIVGVVAFVQLLPIAVQWKSGQAWEDFLQKFVTSPAAAGGAAVLAAVIASATFNRGLRHTKAEDRDKAWWEKFEWVTDRIVPKDPKQERLASGLALSLLGSLEDSSTAGFQREAVAGIKQTYIQGQQTDLSTATLGELKAQLREVQTFADSSWHSGKVSREIRDYAYRLAVSVALREAWEAGNVEFDPELSETLGRRETFDALLGYRGQSAVVETRYLVGQRSNSKAFMRRLFDQHRPLMEANKIPRFIFVINRALPLSKCWMPVSDAVGVVHWEQAHGSEALRDRIQQALDEVVPLSA